MDKGRRQAPVSVCDEENWRRLVLRSHLLWRYLLIRWARRHRVGVLAHNEVATRRRTFSPKAYCT